MAVVGRSLNSKVTEQAIPCQSYTYDRDMCYKACTKEGLTCLSVVCDSSTNRSSFRGTLPLVDKTSPPKALCPLLATTH